MEKYILYAKGLGFTTALELNVSDVIPQEHIRALCTPEKCMSYGTNWVCPPACGELEECRRVLAKYKRGLLLQKKIFCRADSSAEVFKKLSEEFGKIVRDLQETIGKEKADVMALATGGCNECDKCTYPDEPCRKPETKRGSLSAYGIDVGKLCEKNNVEFAFDTDAVYFTACMLID